MLARGMVVFPGIYSGRSVLMRESGGFRNKLSSARAHTAAYRGRRTREEDEEIQERWMAKVSD